MQEYYNKYTFGNNERLDLSAISASSVIRLSLLKPTIEQADFDSALEDINNSWRIIEDKKSGKQFEIALANQNAPEENGLIVEFSTFTSAISSNIGNAVEFAEHAALNPFIRRLYVASPGNGLSSYLDKSERQYFRNTGRMITEDGRPIPTIIGLCGALKSSALQPTKISSNSYGGLPATALMAGLPEGQIEHAYIKGRPGISKHLPALLWGARVMVGDLLDDIKYKKASKDPYKMSPELIDKARQALANLYEKDVAKKQSTRLKQAKSSHAISKLVSDTIAVSKGGIVNNYPASHDTALGLSMQPDAKMTFDFTLHDRLYKDRSDIEVFISMVYEIGSKITGLALTNTQIQAVTAPGGHRDHTYYPSKRWAVESYALYR